MKAPKAPKAPKVAESNDSELLFFAFCPETGAVVKSAVQNFSGAVRVDEPTAKKLLAGARCVDGAIIEA